MLVIRASLTQLMGGKRIDFKLCAPSGPDRTSSRERESALPVRGAGRDITTTTTPQEAAKVLRRTALRFLSYGHCETCKCH